MRGREERRRGGEGKEIMRRVGVKVEGEDVTRRMRKRKKGEENGEGKWRLSWGLERMRKREELVLAYFS